MYRVRERILNSCDPSLIARINVKIVLGQMVMPEPKKSAFPIVRISAVKLMNRCVRSNPLKVSNVGTCALSLLTVFFSLSLSLYTKVYLRYRSQDITLPASIYTLRFAIQIVTSRFSTKGTYSG